MDEWKPISEAELDRWDADAKDALEGGVGFDVGRLEPVDVVRLIAELRALRAAAKR